MFLQRQRRQISPHSHIPTSSLVSATRPRQPLFSTPSNIQNITTPQHPFSALTSKGLWPQEDRCIVLPNIKNGASIYAVFDGHTSAACSQFAIDHLANAINAFPQCIDMKTQAGENLSLAFKKLDYGFLKDHSRGGSTALAMCVCDNHVTVANTGDSRAILVSRNNSNNNNHTILWHPLSVDHKVELLSERERIIRAGARISLIEGWRVDSVLSMTRALGDAWLKHVVIPDPTLVTFTISPHESHFAILATDGVWARLRCDQVAKLIHDAVDVDEAAKRVAHEVGEKGIVDNSTLIVVELNHKTQPER